ncbi:MAG: leucine-rich repeat protein, partial [Bacteroidales bacterium]|nr:leucine-rich repeat protein [Bacteroidales bacterium]
VPTRLERYFSGKDITSFDEFRYFTGVTTLLEYEFENCKQLERITFPDNIVWFDNTTAHNYIGNFYRSPTYGCDKLTRMAGKGVSEDGRYYVLNSPYQSGLLVSVAYSGLTAVNIPEGVTRSLGGILANGTDYTGKVTVSLPSTLSIISAGMFANTTQIESFTIPDTVLGVDQEAFWGAMSLKSVSGTSHLRLLGNSAFGATRIEAFDFPTAITAIPAGVFSSTPIRSFTVPSWIKRIEQSAFANSGLESITFNEGLEYIGAYAFMGLSAPELGFNLLKGDLVLPSTLKTIGYSAFEGQKDLTSITIQATTAPNITPVPGTSYQPSDNGKTFVGTYPIYIPSEAVKSYREKADEDYSPIAWKTYFARLKLIGGADFPEPAIERYVDINGVLWSSWNLGATAPEQPGDYFAWGETSTKTTWGSWWNGNYFDTTGSNYYDSTIPVMGKYTLGTLSGLSTLTEGDDAATANWGSEWRMPTRAEIANLCDQVLCKWTFVTYKGSPGYKVESRSSNGDNWIFLPVSGYWQSSGSWTDSMSIYWSADLDPLDGYYRCAYMMEVYGNNGGFNYRGIERICGGFIRPVHK